MTILPKGTFLLGLVLLSSRGLAQPAPAPEPAEDTDLELPAAPAAAAPPAAAPPAAAPPAAAPPVVAPSAARPTNPAPPQERALPAPARDIGGSRPPVAPNDAPGVSVRRTPPTTPPGPFRGAELRASGYLQAEYQWSDLSEDQLQQGGVPFNQNRFLLRRGRLRFDRAWDYAAAGLELDANTVRGPAVGIRAAEASLIYRLPGADATDVPLVALTLGVTDIPFGYDLLESAQTRPFMERSLASSSLFPSEADAGVKLWGAVSFFRYAIAVMNGEPLDAHGFPRDPNDAKDVLGRLGAEVAVTPGLRVWGGTSFAWGKGFHSGRDARKRSIAWRDTDESGTLQPGGAELQGIPSAPATPSKNFERWVLGLDFGVSFLTPLGSTRLYGEGFLASNYDRGLIRADPVDSPSGDIRHAGAYGALIQEITAYGLVGFRGAFYDPNSDVLDDTRGELVPHSQTISTFSPVAGFVLPGRARLLLQYDFVRDNLGRDASGTPTDAKNDQFTARLQVEL